MMPDFLKNVIKNNLEALKQERGLILSEGILFFFLGFLATALPVVSSLSLEIFFGALFVIGGLAQTIRTYKTWGMEGSLITLCGSLLTFVVGIIMLVNPLAGLFALTSILGVYFLFDGFA